MKGQIKRNLIVAAIVAALFSFIQDFVYFDYSRPGVIFAQGEEEKLNDMLFKDVKRYIDGHTKKHSFFESIKYILSHYRYLSTWQFKLRTFALYFFAVFFGSLLVGIKLRQREISNTS
jgi:hypothetical protein